MTTSSINHRPATVVAVAATTLVGALLAAAPISASAIPEPVDRSDAAGRSADTNDQVRTHGHHVERACFIKPSVSSWTKADGPLPRCNTYVP